MSNTKHWSKGITVCQGSGCNIPHVGQNVRFCFAKILIVLFIFSLLILQAFGQAYNTRRKVAEDGETNEETLLQESASKEAYYMSRLLELQTGVTLSRSVASNAQAENERLNALVQEIREVSILFGN